ncbi:Hypothetical protein AT6N2_L2410 [Agrobacterium tumefaciens]|nr:Hypothetical protein AT6N2_L2410 [Agrobacterium tumefaciens]
MRLRQDRHMRQRVVDRETFQGSVAAKRQNRLETIDLPNVELSQLGTCRFEQLFYPCIIFIEGRIVDHHQLAGDGHIGIEGLAAHKSRARRLAVHEVDDDVLIHFIPCDDRSKRAKAEGMRLFGSDLVIAIENNLHDRSKSSGIAKLKISIQYDPGAVMLPKLDHSVWDLASIALNVDRFSAIGNTEVFHDRSKSGLIFVHMAIPSLPSKSSNKSERP